MMYTMKTNHINTNHALSLALSCISDMLLCFFLHKRESFQLQKVLLNLLMNHFNRYQYPEWFRDAKFGIWAHWGPQAVPRQGDWYAKKNVSGRMIRLISITLNIMAILQNLATRISFRSGKLKDGILKS